MKTSSSPQNRLPMQLQAFLQHQLQPGQRLLLGLSGGLDSAVLLHLLDQQRDIIGFKLAAMHVHHGISPNADAWQQFCAELCERYRVPFQAERVSIARDNGLGIEASARAARYAALQSYSADWIVLAHHRDDQAETLLLQLLRGAGLKGLAAMPAVALPQAGMAGFLRPLLDTPRRELEAYAEVHGLSWIDDESNLDMAYDRNFLRHGVFPAIETRFPAARTTLARSAAHLAEAEALLQEVAAEDAARWTHLGRLRVEGLRCLSTPRANNLLRYWLAGYVSDLPSTRRLREIMRQLLGPRDEAMMEVAVQGGCIRRYRGEAWFARAFLVDDQDVLIWHGEAKLPCAGGTLTFDRMQGQGISLVRIAGESLQLRRRRGGERLRLHPLQPTRSLKNLFQEAGIPAWQRLVLPLVYCQDQLVAVPGIGVADDWRAAAQEEGLLVAWHAA